MEELPAVWARSLGILLVIGFAIGLLLLPGAVAGLPTVLGAWAGAFSSPGVPGGGSAPVSASPSRITQQTTRSGLPRARAVGVGEEVSRLTAFVDRPRGLGSRVAGDSAGERELSSQLRQAYGVPADLIRDIRRFTSNANLSSRVLPARSRTGY